MKIQRSRTDRIIFGVCGGFGKHFDIDPVILRIFFILFTLTNGIGLFVYLILALVIPQEPGISPETSREKQLKKFANDIGNRSKRLTKEIIKDNSFFKSPRNVIGAIIVLVGLLLIIRKSSLFGLFYWVDTMYIGPLAIIIIGLYMILKKNDE